VLPATALFLYLWPHYRAEERARGAG